MLEESNTTKIKLEIDSDNPGKSLLPKLSYGIKAIINFVRGNLVADETLVMVIVASRYLLFRKHEGDSY